ncbi:class B sortase [Turicibacter sanguinis]|uniref:class B sortase n=1 Tax=Turicibacter sanguinis TaxID=154288 RepID=UPI001EE8A2FB|nr:class B sortase [Turicibacter sanguinis]MDB8545827.1 class B sortase [Turicibacter sanguinis]MDB8559634.1 class B sortase [Turicibacter sanguinis]MDB8567995.1 class B sortase [Turicibacter sanguinis]MDB8570744.1 class B sortase [Turicibacter sanguinis]MDB8573499.1 class B sortase [Turicibacter sanguinis]
MIYLKKIIRLLLNLVLILMLTFSVYNIYLNVSQYKKADTIYEDIREVRGSIKNIEDNEDTEKVSESNKSTEGDKYCELSYINSDYRFWLKVDNTNIDYPVVQSKDNNYYLKRDFNKNPLASGSLFMDYRNNFEEDNSVIVYGHHMKNKTMFSELDNFKNESFFYENNLIRVEHKDTTYTYEVFSIYVADFNNEDYLKVDFEDEQDKKKYLSYIKNRSLYKKDIGLNSNDNIITLYTCSYEFENARTIVHGKLISKE